MNFTLIYEHLFQLEQELLFIVLRLETDICSVLDKVEM